MYINCHLSISRAYLIRRIFIELLRDLEYLGGLLMFVRIVGLNRVGKGR